MLRYAFSASIKARGPRLQYGQNAPNGYRILEPKLAHGGAGHRPTKWETRQLGAFLKVAGRTGFEPATEDFAPVTA
jgi:hypothetical protein